VEEAYAALSTLEMRAKTWKSTAEPLVVDGPVVVPKTDLHTTGGFNKLGRLWTTKNPAPGLARFPWTVDNPVERSVAVGPVDADALVNARRARRGESADQMPNANFRNDRNLSGGGGDFRESSRTAVPDASADD
jgi:hypothetical protein